MIEVVIVDDSRMMRVLIDKALTAEDDIVVVGAAADPFEARDLIRATNPDVITLDVEMPKMDGLEFLRRIMALRPMPVVMVSGATTKGAETTLEALEIGAIDFVAKPGSQSGWDNFAELLRQKIRAAAAIKIRIGATTQRACGTARPDHGGSRQMDRAISEPGIAARAGQILQRHRRCNLVAVGASTGGVTAINRLLTDLPAAGHPPMVIAQHMPPGFTGRFADRLARTTGRNVAEASDGESLQPGAIRLAPGDRHLRVVRSGGGLICRLGDDPPVGNHRPSVDALFSSVAAECGERAVGVILTGMGSDGAQGLLKMRACGARTIGEAEISCTVYGMPKAAMKLGAVLEEFPIDALSVEVSRHVCSV